MRGKESPQSSQRSRRKRGEKLSVYLGVLCPQSIGGWVNVKKKITAKFTEIAERGFIAKPLSNSQLNFS